MRVAQQTPYSIQRSLVAIDPMEDNALLRRYRDAGDDAHEAAVPAGLGTPAARREDGPREGAAEEAGYQGALF